MHSESSEVHASFCLTAITTVVDGARLSLGRKVYSPFVSLAISGWSLHYFLVTAPHNTTLQGALLFIWHLCETAMIVVENEHCVCDLRHCMAVNRLLLILLGP